MLPTSQVHKKSAATNVQSKSSDSIYYILILTGYGVRKVHLFHFNDELDLAIFRLNPGEKSWDRFAKFSQFQPAKDFIGSQAWAVGYAARYDDRYDNDVLNPPALLPGGYSDSWKHLMAKQV